MKVRSSGKFGHVLGDAVEHLAHADRRAGLGHMVAEDGGAVGLARRSLRRRRWPTLRRSMSHAATILRSLGR